MSLKEAIMDQRKTMIVFGVCLILAGGMGLAPAGMGECK